MRNRFARHGLVSFFMLAFGISWAVWGPVAAESWGCFRSPIPPALAGLIGAFGPTLAAVVLTLFGEGLGGLRRLLGRLLIWRVNVRWYLFALLWPAAISLATTAVYVLSGGAAPDFSTPPFIEVYPDANLYGEVRDDQSGQGQRGSRRTRAHCGCEGNV